MGSTLIFMERTASVSRLFLGFAALVLAGTAAAQRGGGAAHPASSMPAAGSGAPASHPGFSGPRGSAVTFNPASRGPHGATNLFPAPGITSTRPVYFSNGIARYGTPERRGPRYGYNGGPVGVLSLGYPGGYLGYTGSDYDPDFLNPTYNPNTEPTGEGYGLLPDAVLNPQPPVVNYGGYPNPGYGGYPPPASTEAGQPPSIEEASAAPQPEPSPAPTPFLAPPTRRTPAPAPLPEEDAVTIVFKDGRPPEQIRNYALTRSALYITAGKVRTIPIDDIDLPATEKANAKAGVDFQLPTK